MSRAGLSHLLLMTKTDQLSVETGMRSRPRGSDSDSKKESLARRPCVGIDPYVLSIAKTFPDRCTLRVLRDRFGVRRRRD